MTFTPNVFPTMLNQPLKGLAQIVNATGSSPVTVITAGGNGSKVLSLIATNNDSIAHTILVSLVRSSATYYLSATAVPASSGVASGVPPVDLFAIIPNLPRDQDGQPYLFLNSGDTLIAQLLSGVVTSPDFVCLHSDYANF